MIRFLLIVFLIGASGFGRDFKAGAAREADARALALSDTTGHQVVLVGLPFGLSRALADEIAARCNSSYGLERGQILFLFARPDELSSGNSRTVVNGLVTLVGAALQRLEPATLSFTPSKSGLTVKGSGTHLFFMRATRKDGRPLAVLFDVPEDAPDSADTAQTKPGSSGDLVALVLRTAPGLHPPSSNTSPHVSGHIRCAFQMTDLPKLTGRSPDSSKEVAAYPVQAIRLGDLVLLALAGSIPADREEQIERAYEGRALVVLGNSNQLVKTPGKDEFDERIMPAIQSVLHRVGLKTNN